MPTQLPGKQRSGAGARRKDAAMKETPAPMRAPTEAEAPQPASAGEKSGAPAKWDFSLRGLRVEDLARLGRVLDRRPQSLGGRTVAMAAAEHLLRVRSRSGRRWC